RESAPAASAVAAPGATRRADRAGSARRAQRHAGARTYLRFPRSLQRVRGRDVLAQQVHAEVVRQIAPHRMDVVGVALRVVVLDQKRRTVDTVVMRRTDLRASGPREVDGAG